jgi:hypothetical protein
MVKEQIPAEIKSNRGHLHQVRLKKSNKSVKIFEKKLQKNMFLHIGLKKLNPKYHFRANLPENELD